MQDLSRQCLEDCETTDVNYLRNTFCNYCRNLLCPHAKHLPGVDDKFGLKCKTRVHRFFEPPIIEKSLVDFPDRIPDKTVVAVNTPNSSWGEAPFPVVTSVKEVKRNILIPQDDPWNPKEKKINPGDTITFS